jgi:nicotinate-nucleotide adenylyltransferase
MNRRKKPVSIAVMGGSFDPIHLGHLIIAEQAAEALRADRVLFVPCSIPPHKDAAGLTPGPHRLKMIALAARGNPKFRASNIELARGGVSYTVDTIEQLRGMYGLRVKIWFVIGADSLRELASWKNYRRILDRCTIVTAGRPGSDLEMWRGEGGAFSRE